MIIITDERCIEYSMPGHPERPYRISATLKKLRDQSELAIEWHSPLEVEESKIIEAHTRQHLQNLRSPKADFDGDTPAYPHIDAHAERSVGSALQALALTREGKAAFSLIRPPGHHATQDRAMGFCYLNSVAIMALEARKQEYQRVAVFDFDVHHGNGTEAILLNRPDIAFYSIHQYPCYPGTGTRNVGNNCFNYPTLPQTPRKEYRNTLSKAFEELLKFKPDLIAVSAGFDAYVRDPIAQETLEAEDFYWMGQTIRNAGIPFLSLLEGGYSDDLPELIFAYLKGAAGK